MRHPFLHVVNTPNIDRAESSTGSAERYRPSGSVSLDYVARVPKPSGAPPVYHGYASANLRRHLGRATMRLVGLLAVDALAFSALRWMIHLLRGQPGRVGHVLSVEVPQGFLGGNRFAAAILVSLVVLGCYGPGDSRRNVRQIALACALATSLPLWNRLWHDPYVVLAQYAIVTAALALVLAVARVGVDALVSRLRPHPRARVVLVGPASSCAEMMARTDIAKREAMRFVAFVDATLPGRTTEGTLRELALMLAEHEADTVMLCGHVDEALFGGVIKTATIAECQLLSTSRLFDSAGIEPTVVWRTGHPFIELRAPALRGRQLMLKRVLDIVVSGSALLAAAPIMAAIALAVKLDSPGRAVFGQRRLGRHGRAFKCYKFRSMYTDAEKRLRSDPALYAQYIENDYKLPPALDTRVTRVGRFLRSTSLDELPQLWNVLRGQMSLVGPRPVVPDEIRHYEDEAPLLLLVKPGVTGSWQVNGRSNCAYPERTNLELDYVRNWRLWTDVSILLRTVPAVLLQRGAH